ncbi:MAG: type II secretion system protein GspG [Deltaproteobacteria bacterium]|nr:type II secretion system protein GspG [Deltaproteobacteria bacterium]
MRRRSGEAGFTLIEVVVVVGVIAVLAAILTPFITKYIEDSRRARAQNEAQVVGAAVVNFYKDLGRWPNANNTGAATITGLYTGPAGTPAPPTGFNGMGNWTGLTWDILNNHLVTNANNRYPTTGENRWQGSYATNLPVDPWGRPYVINAAAFTSVATPPAPVWVLSAGPNGTINTVQAATAVGGDDVGYRIR